MNNFIPFSRPYSTGDELGLLKQTLDSQHWQGGGKFTHECEQILERLTGSAKHLLTHSCTGALEMIPILLDMVPGDEVIMPSYTFVSTANAFVRSGVVPVFVDIDAQTKNIDPAEVVKAITDRTKAIVAVNYGGVCAPLDHLLKIAAKAGVPLIEDAAQSIGAKFNNKPLGSIAPLATFSFHATKNIACGEAGSLAINDVRYVSRAEIILEKGTNRQAFMAGQTDKYTWVDVGSSFLPSEFTAGILKTQLEHINQINSMRMQAWETYHEALAPLESAGTIQRMFIPDYCQHNAHVYYMLLPNLDSRIAFLKSMRKQNIQATFHYVPLHDAPGGITYGRSVGPLSNTRSTFERLVRLPLYPNVPTDQVLDATFTAMESI